MARIFISYSHDDREAAQRLAAAVQDYGHEVWWDNQLVGGDDFRDVIEERLSRVDAIIVVWTKSSVAKLWVKAEAHLGLARQNLVPVRFDKDFELPDDFQHIHVEYLGDWAGAPRAPEIGKLVRRIDELKGAADRARLSAALAPQLRAKVQNSGLVRSLFDAALPGGLRVYRFIGGALGAAAVLWLALFLIGRLSPGADDTVGLGIFLFLLAAVALARGLDQMIIAAKRGSSDRFFDRAFSAACVISFLVSACGVLAVFLLSMLLGMDPNLVQTLENVIGIAVALLVLSYAVRAAFTVGRVLQSRV
ncbi:MAG TPA: toll/interleukin-1 receptor domain-containing protein [Caulobacteraceae bacterium]|jgi:hypothetical protein